MAGFGRSEESRGRTLLGFDGVELAMLAAGVLATLLAAVLI
jgi:hypothetical protein